MAFIAAFISRGSVASLLTRGLEAIFMACPTIFSLKLFMNDIATGLLTRPTLLVNRGRRLPHARSFRANMSGQRPDEVEAPGSSMGDVCPVPGPARLRIAIRP